MEGFSRLFIPGPTPSLNDVINAKGGGRGGFSRYTAMKKRWGGNIALLATAARFQVPKAGFYTYLLHERDRRRDPSNALSGAVKMIEDGLQEAGLLENDGWKQVLGMAGYWHVDNVKPGCTLFVSPDRVLTKDEAFALEDQERSKWHARTTP